MGALHSSKALYLHSEIGFTFSSETMYIGLISITAYMLPKLKEGFNDLKFWGMKIFRKKIRELRSMIRPE
jgi:hypothetical protein